MRGAEIGSGHRYALACLALAVGGPAPQQISTATVRDLLVEILKSGGHMGLDDVICEKLAADGEQRTHVSEEACGGAGETPVVPRKALDRALTSCEKQALTKLGAELSLHKKWLQIAVDGS